jgi:hypothetical protein
MLLLHGIVHARSLPGSYRAFLIPAVENQIKVQIYGPGTACLGAVTTGWYFGKQHKIDLNRPLF